MLWSNCVCRLFLIRVQSYMCRQRQLPVTSIIAAISLQFWRHRLRPQGSTLRLHLPWKLGNHLPGYHGRLVQPFGPIHHQYVTADVTPAGITGEEHRRHPNVKRGAEAPHRYAFRDHFFDVVGGEAGSQFRSSGSIGYRTRRNLFSIVLYASC